MLWREHEKTLAAQVHVIAAEDAHAIRHHGEEVARVLTAVVVDVMRRFGWVHRHCTVCTLKPALDVQWLPGAGRLVLSDTIGILPRMTEGRLVQYPRLRPAKVHQRQLHG